MSGFFSDKELQSTSRPDGKVYSCASCGLYQNVNSPKMKPFGEFKRHIMTIGEAPGCISGDSLIEVAFRDKTKHPDGIAMKDLVGKDFHVYSFDIQNQKLTIGKVNRVWKTGTKPVFKVTYEWKYADGNKVTHLQNSIKVTNNHPFLLKKPSKRDPFKGINDMNTIYLSLNRGLSVDHSLQPFHRANRDYSFIGPFAKSMIKESRFLLQYKLGRFLKGKEQCHHKNENKLDDQKDNLIDNHKIISIEYAGEEEVYDMEVEEYHNFAVNGIFVHNSTEDERGRPWQGKTGRLLKRTLQELGVDLFEDCISLNACHCRPCNEAGDNRTPALEEINSCRRATLKYIAEYQPKVVILLGGSAVQSVIGHRWKKDLGGISKWRGWAIPDQDLKCWILPVFHPSYVSREDAQVMTIWKADLRRAIEHTNLRFPKNKEPRIDFITDLKPLTSIREHLSLMAFDYETTGLKPHRPGHRIICVAIAITADHAYTFLMPKTKGGWKPFADILEDPTISKMAHNIKYEDTWTTIRLRISIRNWEWDSMQAAHVQDNRQGITGLKFQVYVNFGVIDYASEITPYLKAPAAEEKSHGGNSFNRIQELLDQPGGPEKLLTYCAYDAIWEYRLAMKQIKELNYDFLPF